MTKFKTYQEYIDYLYSMERQGIKYDLKNIYSLMMMLGNPHTEFKSVHIAGTNGKGSVASMTASVMQEAKYKTGLYTSPHILDFRERIKINGERVSKKYITDFIDEYFDNIEEIQPSFFEVTTAIAFKYFADNKVDIAIVEAGMGGRLDSTNVLQPLVCAITSISMDHMQYLGDTIEKIAYEKAGIIKENGVCVIGMMSEEAIEVIKYRCDEMNAEFIDAEDVDVFDYRIDKEYSELSLSDKDDDDFYDELGMIEINLPGIHQIDNTKVVIRIIKELKQHFKIETESILNGIENVIENTGLHGRLEQISYDPLIILDVAHNPEALQTGDHLDLIYSKQPIIIFSMMEDKDIEGCLKLLDRPYNKLIITQLKIKRAMNAERIYEPLKNKSNIILTHSVEEAYKKALKLYNKNSVIYVVGSFYLAEEFLKISNLEYD